MQHCYSSRFAAILQNKSSVLMLALPYHNHIFLSLDK